MYPQVCSAVTNTSSQTCYICGCRPSQMNNLDQVFERQIKTENLKFGLSVLHAHIRFLECLLHVAYRIEIKTWRVCT